MTRMRARVAVVQMRPTACNVRRNVGDIIGYIRRAKNEGAEIVVLPETATTDYILGDTWEYDEFIRDIEAGDEEIRRASDGIIAVWGSVKADWNKIGEDGRVRLYNAARIAMNGEWVSNGVLDGWIPKTNLANYRIYEDPRHFFAGDKLAAEMGLSLKQLLRPFPVTLRGRKVKLALTICEDLWEDEHPAKVSRIYRAQHADLIIDISASPWTAGKYRARNRMLKNRVKDSGLPILYVNKVGLENNTKNHIWFDGDSTFINARGVFMWRAPQHEEGLFVFELGKNYRKSMPERVSETEEIYEALVRAMREYYTPFERVVVGLSGGIDSAVKLALLVEAVGPKKVIAINMPSDNNSPTTRRLAKQCAKNLGVEYRVVPIQKLVDLRVKVLAAAGFHVPKKGLVIENIQARERGAGMLAAIAQLLDGVFTNNGNKTENALNYFTLYGDGAGCAAFLGDLWKGQIYALARFINKRAGRELIPQGIIDLVPSAELSPDQNVDEGKGDPIFYPYHDCLLRAFLEKRWGPATVLGYAIRGDLEKRLGCEKGTIKKYFPTRMAFVKDLEWAWKKYTTEFKRPLTPPVFTASRRSLGHDRRATIAVGFRTVQYDVNKKLFLGAEA